MKSRQQTGKKHAITVCLNLFFLYASIYCQVELLGCKGIWTVYHKNTRSHNADSSKLADDDDEYHAYLIISLEARTMVTKLYSILFFEDLVFEG